MVDGRRTIELSVVMTKYLRASTEKREFLLWLFWSLSPWLHRSHVRKQNIGMEREVWREDATLWWQKRTGWGRMGEEGGEKQTPGTDVCSF